MKKMNFYNFIKTLFFLFLSFLFVGYSSPVFAKIIYLKDLGTFSSTKMEKQGLSHFILTQKNETTKQVQVINNQGAILKTIEFNQTDKKILNEFRPSFLSNYSYYLKNSSPHILKSKVKTFPIEALSFFVALGALTSYEIVFNYSKNPVATEQFIDSQTDLVSQVALSALIFARGLTAEPLLMATENPVFRSFIPYLGLTVGLIASNIVYEVGHFPFLKDCALKKLNCDKAYDAWVEYPFEDKFHEWNPGLISMLLSTLLSGSIDFLIRQSSSQILRYVGTEFAFSISPSGWLVKTGRTLYTLASMAGFMYLDHILIEPINFAYQNAIGAGPELKNQSEKLIQKMASPSFFLQSQSSSFSHCNLELPKNFSDTCTEDFSYLLIGFSRSLKKWQDFNLSTILVSHQNWLKFLSSLSIQYQTSKSFYFNFISYLWKQNHQKSNYFSQSLLNLKFPFYGIYKNDSEKVTDEEILFNPIQIENEQWTWLTLQLKSHFLTPEFTQFFLELSKHEQNWLSQFLELLTSNDKDKVGQGLQQLSHLLKKQTALKHTQVSAKTLKKLRSFSQDIGPDFEPLMAPGEILLKIFTNQSDTLQKNVFHVPLSYYTDSSDFLLNQMLFGPNPQENTVISYNSSGFPIHFIPPKILLSYASFEFLTPKLELTTPINYLYKTSYHKIKDKNLLENFVIPQMQNLIYPPFINNPNGTLFGAWWESEIDKQMKEALNFYKTEYKKIINQMITKFLSKTQSITNKSELSNNPLSVTIESLIIYTAIISYHIDKPIKPLFNQTLLEWSKFQLINSYHLKDFFNKINSWNFTFNRSIESEIVHLYLIKENILEYINELLLFVENQSQLNPRLLIALKNSLTEQAKQTDFWVSIIEALDPNLFIHGESTPPLNCNKQKSLSLNLFLKNKPCEN